MFHILPCLNLGWKSWVHWFSCFHPCELRGQDSFNLCVLFLDFCHLSSNPWTPVKAFLKSFSSETTIFSISVSIDYFYWFSSWVCGTIFCFFSYVVSKRGSKFWGLYCRLFELLFFPFKNAHFLMQAHNCRSLGFLNGLFLNLSSWITKDLLSKICVSALPRSDPCNAATGCPECSLSCGGQESNAFQLGLSSENYSAQISQPIDFSMHEQFHT